MFGHAAAAESTLGLISPRSCCSTASTSSRTWLAVSASSSAAAAAAALPGAGMSLGSAEATVLRTCAEPSCAGRGALGALGALGARGGWGFGLGQGWGLDVCGADLGTLVHGHEDDRLDDRQPDGGHDAQRQRADQRVLVREVTLERVDRQQREVRLVASVAHEVHVDELLQLEVRHRDVLHDVGEKTTWCSGSGVKGVWWRWGGGTQIATASDQAHGIGEVCHVCQHTDAS